MIGRETMELNDGSTEAAWIVRQTLPAGHVDHWVGERSRLLLRLRTAVGPNGVMTFRR